MQLKLIALLLISLMTSGCSSIPWLGLGKGSEPPPPVEVKVKTVPVKIKITQPVLPRAIDLKDPQWYVVSSANLEEFLARIEKEAGTVVFFAMSPGDYELMAYNMQEIKRYVQEMNEVIVYYRKVTLDEPEKTEEPAEEKADEKVQ